MAGRRVDYLLMTLLDTVGMGFARLPQDKVRFIGELRPLIPGPPVLVSELTDDEILTSVARRWETFGGGGIHVATGGTVLRARDVLTMAPEIQDHAAFVQDAVTNLLAESRRLDPEDPLNAVLGADWLGRTNPTMLSAEERILRLQEAVLTASGEALVNRLPPRRLFDPPMIGRTVDYVRGHIMRNGTENGNNFQLLDALMDSGQPFRVQPRYQIQLPELKAPHSPTYGFDVLLESSTGVVPKSVKSVNVFKALLQQRPSLRYIGDALYEVEGSEFLRQTIEERCRNALWGHNVPGRTVLPPFPNGLPDDLAGWQPVSHVTLTVFDSPFLVNTASEMVAHGLMSARTATISITRDLDLPGPVKTQLRAIIGGSTIRRDMPRAEMRDLAFRWIEGQVPLWQDRANAILSNDPAVRRALESMPLLPEIRLAGSHQQGLIGQFYSDLDLLLNPVGP